MVVFSVLPLLLLLGFGIVVVVVIRAAGGGKRVKEPACAACGYAVQGLETFTCPECGSDLREVGILTPNSRRGMTHLGWAVLWTVLLPVPALLISFMVSAMLPVYSTKTVDHTLFGPDSDLYDSVEMTATGAGTQGAWAVPTDEVTMQLVLDSGPFCDRLRIRATDLSYAIEGPSGTPPTTGGFSAEAVLAWLASAGLDAENPALVREAEDLYQQARDLATGGVRVPDQCFSGTSGGGSTTSGPPPWFAPTALGFWLLLWVGGLIRLFRRRP